MAGELDNVPIGELLYRAENGDSAAQAALEDFGRDMAKIGEESRARMSSMVEDLPQPRVDFTAVEDLTESIARAKARSGRARGKDDR